MPPTPLWDPLAILRLSSPVENRCIGHAVSKGRKCTVIIARHNVSNAETILSDISREQPDTETLRPQLRKLAGYLLCVRWHQGQAGDLVERWSARMLEAYPYGIIADPTAEEEEEEKEGDADVSPNEAEESENLQETLASIREALRVARSRVAEESYPSPPSTPSREASGPSRVDTLGIPSLHLSRTSTASEPAMGPTAAAVRSSASRCTTTHVRRRNVDDGCAICLEEMSSEEDLAWCKRSCGRSVHKDCFEQWKAQCVSEGREASCPHCRAGWDWDCACE